MDAPRIEPGTLDLSPRLPSNPALRAEVVEARAVCDTLGHPPGCFNPWTDTTYASAGSCSTPGTSPHHRSVGSSRGWGSSTTPRGPGCNNPAPRGDTGV